MKWLNRVLFDIALFLLNIFYGVLFNFQFQERLKVQGLPYLT